VRPLGFDWKIGVSIAASFAAARCSSRPWARSTAWATPTRTSPALRDRLRAERDPRTGVLTYSPLVAVGLMVFYVYALMCMSTIAVTVRESGGGGLGVRWAALQFGYMLGLAYGAAWLVYTVGRALGWG
jgi:ferrous iron transport protein B